MKRSKFALSHYKLLSCDMGELIPCGITEVLPGDTIQHSTSALIRCSPMLAPVMHPVHVRIHHWFVPHRLVWDDFEDFITGGPLGTDASVFPTITVTPSVGSLFDYYGVPTGTAVVVSALPIRGYQLIWNENYRDQDLETAATIDTTSGDDITTNWILRNCAWEKDYFTSARPWEQKGPSITIPLGTSADVRSAAATSGDISLRGTGTQYNKINTGGSFASASATDGGSANKLYADLSGASAVTVNILREALALQRFEEARARFGSRYVEYLRYLGVRSSDARLSRPEYLGGGKQTIQFSEIVQTAEGTDPVGDLKGHGIGAMRSNRYRRFIEEHGYIHSFLSVRPKTMYSQGLFRHWNRRTKEDFWQKELQHIGQQEVLNKEVYAAHGTPDGIFGYQDRYDEYRRSESTVAGEFRSSVLNFWHLAREFASAPALNADFVKAVPSERIFAVPSQDVLYCMCNHSIQARRMVAATGTSFVF